MGSGFVVDGFGVEGALVEDDVGGFGEGFAVVGEGEGGDNGAFGVLEAGGLGDDERVVLPLSFGGEDTEDRVGGEGIGGGGRVGAVELGRERVVELAELARGGDRDGDRRSARRCRFRCRAPSGRGRSSASSASRCRRSLAWTGVPSGQCRWLRRLRGLRLQVFSSLRVRLLGSRVCGMNVSRARSIMGMGADPGSPIPAQVRLCSMFFQDDGDWG